MGDDRTGNPWTQEEEDRLRTLYFALPREKVAERMKRSEGAIANKAWRLGLTKRNMWTEEEEQRLREYYESRRGEPLRLKELARELGRARSHIVSKAVKMGLPTNKERPKSEEHREKMSENQRRYIEEHGHPKGMLGKSHSEETCELFSRQRRGKSLDFSEEQIQDMSDRMKRMRSDGTISNPYSRTNSGKREDLGGQFFRSSWEANYARYLNWLQENGEVEEWQYEPDRFDFPIERGTRSYTPDFKVWLPDEGGPIYREVKGWMDDKSKTRLRRMEKYHPDVTVEVVGEEAYKEIRTKVAGMIPNWETGEG